MEFKVTKYKEPRCGQCKHIKEGSTFSFNCQNFTENSDMSCSVKNVIYVITCRGCGKYYIDETKNLRKRTTLHNQHIRHENLRIIPVSGHIASCSDNNPMFLSYKMNSDSIIERKEKEKYFITKFKPQLNSA